MRIRYTPRALADLNRIHSYIAEHNPSAAARVVGVVERRINALYDHPEIGYRADEVDVRIILAIPYPYRIYYRVAAAEIEILHIRHTSRWAPTAGEL
jgi:toxin ParE1/3/4